MNRRNFLASLVALPAGLVAAAKACAKPSARQLWAVDWSDISFGNGVYTRLNECGKAVEPGPIDLDAIFNELYRIRRNRSEFIEIIRRE